MTQDIEDDSPEHEELLHGGYCYRLREAGPFVLGKDFEAPRSEGGTLRQVNLKQESDKLWDFVSSKRDSHGDANSAAALFDAEVARLDFENDVTQALSWHVSDYQHEANISEIRKQLRDLCQAIERFKSKLPSESSALGHFLYKTFTGEVLLNDRLKPSPAQVNALEDTWREHAGFDALQRKLEVMLRNIDSARFLLGASKRPPQHQVTTFVRTLAMTWKSATGQWPKSGRDPDSGQQSGPFADFVQATNNLFPSPFRIHYLDRAIRTVCNAPSSS
jgi:hypothetical protein